VAQAHAAEAARLQAVEDLGAAQGVSAQAIEALTAAEQARDAALARAAAAEHDRDAAVTRARAAETALAEARTRLEEALAASSAGTAEALARADDAEARNAEAERRAQVADLRAEDAERRLFAVQGERDEARAAVIRAEATVEDEVSILRADLDLALAAREELEVALAAEREARELAERRLADGGPQAVIAQAPAVMTSPYANGRPSLPPLEVAAAQAKAFAFAAPSEPEGPPPGFTPDALEVFDAALAKSSSPRAAGRAALQALATATGWTGGALWQPRDETEFGCAETWSAYMSGLEAWETMAWRAHLEDGLVPAAAGSGEAHWADTEEMLACPRSRSAAWAELGTLATVPVVHPDGRVIAVLELVRKTRDAPDTELLATLCGVAVRLAERLAAIEAELATATGRY
jgi:ParB family chromosome partitioning protein